ncbi:MAG: phosphoribosyltransferase [Flavobacteriaceae bacterium]|nr:MAG: phosphoribosyltransferase [Flavobacteriaceae bacterium]
MFRNRTEAGYLLAGELLKYKGEPLVVMAIPRGGLPLGAIVADALQAPLEVALTKKIGHPFNREYAIGAVSRNQVVLSKPEGISQSYIASETIRLRKKLEERHRLFHRKKNPVPLKGKQVIIIDDGIATGNTLRVTIALISAESPDKIIVAIPVAPPEAVERLRDMAEVAEVICLNTPRNFRAVGQFYEDFAAVSDEEALAIFEREASYKDP